MLRAAKFTGGRTPLGAGMRDPQTSVEIDLIGSAFEGDERALVHARRARQALPVISAPHLVLMKLETGRAKDYADVNGPWEYLGTTPMPNLRLPIGHYRWKFSKSGFAAIEMEL